ncbi:glycosyltransferase family 2 protein [Streptomyces sp. NPDC001981]|uniref:glycosyltransferase family 2 protein n=1 Tax=Streptomyces sp. NPDC001981 TaxID=3364628 RepID=UPI00369E718D
MTVRVGVVIAAMNSVEFLDQALGSLATQTVPVDEVVVVDDCSDDNTAAHARRWTSVLPLRVIGTGRRTGIWGGRRAGISELTTDLVMQLDADDMFAPHHVEVMRDTYTRRPGLVSPRPLTWTGRGPWQQADYPKARFPLPGDQLAQLLCTNYVIVGAMYPRKLYEEIGGYRQTRYGEDWDLWLRLVAAGAMVSKPDEASYVYRVRAASYSSLFDKDVAQTEVLTRFLSECDSPAYRRIAKLALLQRIGPAFTEGLPARGVTAAQELILAEAGLSPERVRAAHADPELGLVVRVGTGNGAHGGEHIAVLGSAPERLVLAGPVCAGGRIEADLIEDETLRRDRSSLRDILR